MALSYDGRVELLCLEVVVSEYTGRGQQWGKAAAFVPGWCGFPGAFRWPLCDLGYWSPWAFTIIQQCSSCWL